jgi:hypothetical protein
MANIPGGSGVLPGVYTNVYTNSTAVSVPGGTRIAAIIGTGARNEIVVASANGSGNDGLNPTYSGVTGSDGRHFVLNFFPEVSNWTQLFKNGVPLIGLEGVITATSTFSYSFDYMFNPVNGQIELQTAHLVDQGGSYYVAGATNIGVGYIPTSGDGYLELVDVNAPTETWTIKCISVQRNNLNQPIPGTAIFVAFGSVSGNVLDANGNTITWIANGTVASNSILSFAIFETQSGNTTISPFNPGDYFTVEVASGVLVRGDSLTAVYIPEGDLNNPIFQSSMSNILNTYGAVSLTNTLSLGCQLAFANSTPGIMCVEAAPPLPRRISYDLETNFPATSTNCNDFIVPLPLNVQPDPNSAIHVFVTNPTTGVETQLLPNKYPFYTLGTVGNPTTCAFVVDNTEAPNGNSFAYSVNRGNATVDFGQDGYLNRNLTVQTDGYFSSASYIFDLSNIGMSINIIDSNNNANISLFTNPATSLPTNSPGFLITNVVGGVAQIIAQNGFAAFVNDGSNTATFELVDSIFLLPVVGASGTVTISASSPDYKATLVSSISLATYSPLVNQYKLRVTSASNSSNVGLFDITAFNGTTGLTIEKAFVSESSLKFEVIDTTQTSDYLVLNHNIVPNGNNLRVTIVDIKDAAFFDAGWETALASLETQEIDILVTLPMQTISVIFQNALSHCLEMSNIVNRKERVLFLGAINGLMPDNLTGAQLAAVESIGILEGIQGNTVAEILAGDTEDLLNYSVPDAFGETFRAVYFYPDQIVVQVGSSNQIIDGFYIAAAGAGFLSGVTNVAVPLTNKILSGFTILNNRTFNTLTLQELAAAGVTTLAPVAGGGNVLWGLTTTQSGFPEEQEISIVFIRDRIAKSFRAAFSGFVGNPETSDTQSTLLARATSMLNSFVTQQLITAYTGLNVVQDAVEPRQWDISVLVSPAYPVNWIYISVGIGTI